MPSKWRVSPFRSVNRLINSHHRNVDFHSWPLVIIQQLNYKPRFVFNNRNDHGAQHSVWSRQSLFHFRSETFVRDTMISRVLKSVPQQKRRDTRMKRARRFATKTGETSVLDPKGRKSWFENRRWRFGTRDTSTISNAILDSTLRPVSTATFDPIVASFVNLETIWEKNNRRRTGLRWLINPSRAEIEFVFHRDDGNLFNRNGRVFLSTPWRLFWIELKKLREFRIFYWK